MTYKVFTDGKLTFYHGFCRANNFLRKEQDAILLAAVRNEDTFDFWWLENNTTARNELFRYYQENEPWVVKPTQRYSQLQSSNQ